MRMAFPGSVAMHLAAATAILLPAWLSGLGARGLPADPPPIEVELVRQDPAQQGGPMAVTSPPRPAPPAPPSPAASSPAPPRPVPQATTPEPAPPPAPAAPPQAPPAPVGEPSVNLGDADRDLDGLVVSGEHIVPPAPDAVFRNKPPGYPADAARRHAEGTVHLMIRVSELGVPDAVVVTGSSGTPSLDRAAREAVLLWRFRPARNGGAAVPFDYPLDIRFRIGDDP